MVMSDKITEKFIVAIEDFYLTKLWLQAQQQHGSKSFLFSIHYLNRLANVDYPANKKSLQRTSFGASGKS